MIFFIRQKLGGTTQNIKIENYSELIGINENFSSFIKPTHESV